MFSEGLRCVVQDDLGFPTMENNRFSVVHGAKASKRVSTREKPLENGEDVIYAAHSRLSSGAEATVSHSLPGFHASGQGPWCTVISYEACVRLCLRSSEKGYPEAPMFLKDECALLRNAFGLQNILLPPEEELLSRQSSEVVYGKVASRPKHTIGKLKVRVRKVKMDVESVMCSFVSLKLLKKKVQSLFSETPKEDPTLSPSKQKKKSMESHITTMKLTLTSGMEAVRKSCKSGSLGPIKEFCSKLKVSFDPQGSGSPSYKLVSELYFCILRLKSSAEDDAVKMQSGSTESHVFLPNNSGDDLILQVVDSNGTCLGRVLAQVAVIAEDPGDKLRWWPIYREPEHEVIGRIQLQINYSTTFDENSHVKCGCVAETVAYDMVLEVVMKAHDFQQRNLLFHGPWKWLLTEFASYYGVSDAYTKLRYLSHVMDVATPTADCLLIVYNFLSSVLAIEDYKNTLSHQENRILGEIVDQVQEILALVFENYKSLDESSLSGLMNVFLPATGISAPVLAPAVKLYNIFYDTSSPDSRLKLCRYFQTAAKKRSKMHLAETDDFVSNCIENKSMDAILLSTAYQKMKSLCVSMHNEIFTDIEIHEQSILPSFVDLPNLLSPIYSGELSTRIRMFLSAYPPVGPSPPVVDLVVRAANFERDLASWGICHVKGGVDAKELFHSYIDHWIRIKRKELLDSCKLDTVKRAGVKTQHSTTPFVDAMYDHLMGTLDEYDRIIRLWPEYAFPLESAMADIERAIMEALDKQYADILLPLKEGTKIFGIKYVQKIAKGTPCPYTVPEELGIFMNSMKRVLDVLHQKLESRFESWNASIADDGNIGHEEHPGEVTVMLRTKFRSYLQAIVEKLTENSRMQSTTKLKVIMKGLRESPTEADVRSKMQPLTNLLMKTIQSTHTLFENHVFVSICRGIWERLGQDVLSFLENRRNNSSWYKGSRIAVMVLNGVFASEMQRLLGNALQGKDSEPPGSIQEVQSVLCGHQ